MDTIRWQTAQNVCDEETKYKAVVMYLPFVSRCHLKDRITLLMYACTEKTGERLPILIGCGRRKGVGFRFGHLLVRNNSRPECFFLSPKRLPTTSSSRERGW